MRLPSRLSLPQKRQMVVNAWVGWRGSSRPSPFDRCCGTRQSNPASGRNNVEAAISPETAAQLQPVSWQSDTSLLCITCWLMSWQVTTRDNSGHFRSAENNSRAPPIENMSQGHNQLHLESCSLAAVRQGFKKTILRWYLTPDDNLRS